jgi:hypothetical protein
MIAPAQFVCGMLGLYVCLSRVYGSGVAFCKLSPSATHLSASRPTAKEPTRMPAKWTVPTAASFH